MSNDEKQPGANQNEAKPSAPQGAPVPTTEQPQATQPAPQTEGAAGAEPQAEAKPEAPSPPAETPPKRRRGFAAMDRERVREIASKGGRAAHAAGTAHQFTSEEARIAGRKGGLAPHVRRGGVRRRPPTETPERAPEPGQPSEGQGESR